MNSAADAPAPPLRPRGTATAHRTWTLLVVALVVVAVAVGIAVGVFALTHAPAPDGRGSPDTGTETSTPTAGGPGRPSTPPAEAPLTAFDPSAPLQKNVDLFNRTAAAVAATANPVGSDFTNALAAVGFDKRQMQITPDRTTINSVAPAIVFAVKVDEKCLLGQYTPSSHEYDHQVVEPISTGSCLIGAVAPAQ